MRKLSRDMRIIPRTVRRPVSAAPHYKSYVRIPKHTLAHAMKVRKNKLGAKLY